MKKITLMLLLIQSGFMMAQTETVVTPNGKKVQIYTNPVITADNGLTNTSGNVQFGGALTKATTLTTTSVNYLSIKGLQNGSVTDQLLTTDVNGVVRKINISDIGTTTAGTNVTVTGTGTSASPYIISSPFQTATQTPSTSITAVTNSTVAVPSTNVQGAISDLAKELSQKWGTKGNAGTTAGTNFIGTTDGQDVVFKRSGIESGRISSYGTSFGYGSLLVGYNLLNTALGTNALAISTGGNNTAIGHSVLSANTTGEKNTAIGSSAMSKNTTGTASVAIGDAALSNITSGDENVVIGSNSATSFQGTPGSNDFTSGSYNVYIGAYTTPLANGAKNEIIIGYGAKGKGSNTVTIGNNEITSIGGYAFWSNYSDSRLKKNIVSSTYGLDFITKLRPVLYNMKTGTTELQTGFIAQEVETAANSIGYKFSGVVKPQNDNDFYSLSYGAFVVPLVKAVQEQQKQLEEKNARILDLENRLLQLEQKLK